MAVRNLSFYDYHPKTAELTTAVLAGLKTSPKSLPTHLLYDETGSKLFDEICDLDEYYLTRTEIGILRKYSREIAERIGDPSLILELGCGSSTKIRILLDQLSGKVTYVPVDISKDHLLKSCEQLAADFPGVEVVAVCADFTENLALPERCGSTPRKVLFFPGSTIGNLEPRDAKRMLVKARRLLGSEGALLIGVDLKKDPRLFHHAYNDRLGVTEQFEKNVLIRLNRELGAEFDPLQFDYEGTYNVEIGRVEMFLVSRKRQNVRIAGVEISFERDERIHVENSYKYSVEQFFSLARGAGLTPTKTWLDERGWFSVHFLECGERRPSEHRNFVSKRERPENSDRIRASLTL